jgi:hypothetical protein
VTGTAHTSDFHDFSVEIPMSRALIKLLAISIQSLIQVNSATNGFRLICRVHVNNATWLRNARS